MAVMRSAVAAASLLANRTRQHHEAQAANSSAVKIMSRARTAEVTEDRAMKGRELWRGSRGVLRGISSLERPVVRLGDLEMLPPDFPAK